MKRSTSKTGTSWSQQFRIILSQVAFRRFDVDNSGTITVENLREVLGETFEGNEVQNLLRLSYVGQVFFVKTYGEKMG